VAVKRVIIFLKEKELDCYCMSH